MHHGVRVKGLGAGTSNLCIRRSPSLSSFRSLGRPVLRRRVLRPKLLGDIPAPRPAPAPPPSPRTCHARRRRRTARCPSR